MCGLTNYHVTRSWGTDHTVSRKIRRHPVVLESPARVKHNYTIWDLNDRIRANRDGEPGWREEEFRHGDIKAEKLERDRAAKLAFFDTKKNDCGSVLLASGFDRVTPEGGRLDWAVIEVNPFRIGENRLPTEETWDAKYGGWTLLMREPSAAFYSNLRSPSRTRLWLLEPVSGRLAQRLGPRTGPSTSTR
ncbi:hypothetical protein FALCPG4_005743 [Fusarium falciforme]